MVGFVKEKRSMRRVSLPSWGDTDEKAENIERHGRTLAEAVLSGSELTPLEDIINNNEPADSEESAKFRHELKKLVEWCLNNPEQVLANHEEETEGER